MDDHFFEEEDLVVASPNDRNWKGIIIAVLVISSILALIVTSVVLLTPPDEGPRVKGRRFEIADIFDSQFSPLRLNGSWISDIEWSFRDEYGGASVLDVKTLKIKSIISNYTFSRFNAVSFSLSANQKYALLTHDIKKIHRFSFHAKYTVVDILTGDSKALGVGGGDRHGRESRFELIKWCPVGNCLLLVHQGDIYYKENPNESDSLRLTYSASPGLIYNGVPDWLYEEEILGSNSAVWFSTDSQKILYLTFNDTLVGEHHMLQYGSPTKPLQYPQIKTLRYPKPGTNNPIVTATICDLKGGPSGREKFLKQKLEPPEGISSYDHYIVGGGWIKNSDVGIIWTTRSYNVSIISTCSSLTGRCEEEYRIVNEKRGWIDNIQFPHFSTRGNSKNFIGIVPIRDGENGFFDHLIFVDSASKRSHPITHGSYDVTKIHSWDEERKVAYYTGIPSGKPNERRLYRIKIDSPYSEQIPECLTCPLPLPPQILTSKRSQNDEKLENSEQVLLERTSDSTWSVKTLAESSSNANSNNLGANEKSGVETKGDRSNKSCSFVTEVKFSISKNNFVMECSGKEIPYVALYASGHDREVSTVRVIKVLQNNDALLELSQGMAFPQLRTFPVILENGKRVEVRLFLPPGLREDEITTYPLIVHVYGGPGTQLAVDRWSVDFTTFLATKKDYIVAQIDGRGSGGRGWGYQHQVYYNLGHLEADDQIEVTKYLRDSLPYVESNKIGIFGWSYGGYLTALIMTNKDKAHLFQCGASIAPVSKWDLYDSAYSERYMGTPNVTDNLKGYVNSDITKNIESLDKKMFYLIHGTGDDNVHISHSMLLAKALVDKKILFRQQIYPDEEHNLNGAKLHVHRSLEEFFEDCYKKQTKPEVETGLNKGGKFDDFD